MRERRVMDPGADVVPPRVRVLAISAALNVGGAERHLAQLIPRLQDFAIDASVLTLLGRGRFYDELERELVTVRYAELRHRADLVGIGRAIRAADEADVILTQTLAAQVIGAFIAASTRAPHVTAEHHPPGLPRRPHEGPLVRALAPRTDAVVAITRTQMPELVGLGYRRERIRVIPNGISSVAPTRDRQELRRELGFEGEEVVVLLVATLRPQKRPGLFIEAVTRAHTLNPRIRGLLAGGGPELAAAEEQARSTAGIVRTLGERSDAIELMHAADVVCLSSIAEGLPLAVLEAMALAKPVVATDVGGVRDAVVPEVTGLLVPAEDPNALARALARVADDAGLRRRLGRAARERQARFFDVDRVAASYALLLHSLAQAARRR